MLDDTCGDCHTYSGDDVKDIRVSTDDFDGDGNIQEGIAYEIEALQTALYEAIQFYARNELEMPIGYDPNTYPYFFLDTNRNSKIDPDEATVPNQYNAWSPRLLKAAYNYHYVVKDPGAYAHNSTYILQILYDSLLDIGGDVSSYPRP